MPLLNEKGFIFLHYLQVSRARKKHSLLASTSNDSAGIRFALPSHASKAVIADTKESRQLLANKVIQLTHQVLDLRDDSEQSANEPCPNTMEFSSPHVPSQYSPTTDIPHQFEHSGLSSQYSTLSPTTSELSPPSLISASSLSPDCSVLEQRPKADVKQITSPDDSFVPNHDTSGLVTKFSCSPVNSDQSTQTVGASHICPSSTLTNAREKRRVLLTNGSLMKPVIQLDRSDLPVLPPTDIDSAPSQAIRNQEALLPANASTELDK